MHVAVALPAILVRNPVPATSPGSLPFRAGELSPMVVEISRSVLRCRAFLNAWNAAVFDTPTARPMAANEMFPQSQFDDLSPRVLRYRPWLAGCAYRRHRGYWGVSRGRNRNREGVDSHERSIRAARAGILRGWSELRCFTRRFVDSRCSATRRGFLLEQWRRRIGRFELAMAEAFSWTKSAKRMPRFRGKLLRVLQEHEIERLGWPCHKQSGRARNRCYESMIEGAVRGENSF